LLASTDADDHSGMLEHATAEEQAAGALIEALKSSAEDNTSADEDEHH